MGVKLKQCTDFEKHYERLTDILGGNRDLDPCPWCLQQRIEELECLVKTLLENDPDDYAADAVTVLEVWRKEARKALEEG